MPWVPSDSGVLFYICGVVWKHKGSCNDWTSFIEPSYDNTLTYFYSLLFVFSRTMSREIEITSSHTICGQLKHYSLILQTKEQPGLAHTNGLSLRQLYLDHAYMMLRWLYHWGFLTCMTVVPRTLLWIPATDWLPHAYNRHSTWEGETVLLHHL